MQNTPPIKKIEIRKLTGLEKNLVAEMKRRGFKVEIDESGETIIKGIRLK